MMRFLATLMVLLALDRFAAFGQEIAVNPDKLNLVGNRREGDWVLVPELTRRLDAVGRKRLSFKSDPSVLRNMNQVGKIPEKLAELLKRERIYLAGLFGQEGDDHYPFVLISLRGNPYVIYFVPKGANIFGNPESFHVFVALARDQANDLLFIGGERDSPFAVYERRMRTK